MAFAVGHREECVLEGAAVHREPREGDALAHGQAVEHPHGHRVRLAGAGTSHVPWGHLP